MQLHNLRAPAGANRKRKRVGRGESSGWGKTSGRGHKGQGARSGKGKPGPGFEGGQNPMYRRMPKRGFTNIFAKNWAEVNLDMLPRFFGAEDVINLESLRAVGLAKNRDAGVRILGRGELAVALKIEVSHVTAGAKTKIEAAGGSVTIID